MPLLPRGFSTSHDGRYAAILITDGEFVVALEIGLPRCAHAIWREIAESIATCELAWSASASRENCGRETCRLVDQARLTADVCVGARSETNDGICGSEVPF